MLPTSTGWAFPHTTLVLRQVLPRTPFENEFAGVQTATKHVRMGPQRNQGAHQQIDQEFEENVFSLQVVHCLQSVEQSPKGAQLPSFVPGIGTRPRSAIYACLCRRPLPQASAAGLCRRPLPQASAAGLCHTYRIFVCPVIKAREASSYSPVAGVHIRKRGETHL